MTFDSFTLTSETNKLEILIFTDNYLDNISYNISSKNLVIRKQNLVIFCFIDIEKEKHFILITLSLKW